MTRTSKRRRRRSRRQRELLRAVGYFRWFGVAGIALGALVGAWGGSSTLAWTIGTSGAWALGYSLLLPLVARLEGLTWWLVGLTLCTAFVGGIAYLLVPSDVTWWLGQLTALPAIALGLYFFDRTSGGAQRSESSSEGPWSPPSDGGGGGGV